MTSAFPLHWPPGWPRTPASRRRVPGAVFGKYGASIAAARGRLADELDRIGAGNVVLSTNVELRIDGQPRSGLPEPADPGVAVYFSRSRKPMVMARDAWTTVAANINSLAIAIEHLRGLERHGGAIMVERAFTGFEALPEPDTWWGVLGLRPDATEDQIDARYREMARSSHPDAGGSNAAMSRLNWARDEAKRR